MIPIIKSIELVEDPALLVGLKSGAFIKLQPQVKLESFPANSTFLGAPRPPFLLLTDFEKEKVKIDTTIEEISGAPFSGNFADLEAAIGGLVDQVNNGASTGGNIFDQFGSLGNYFQTQSFKGGTILPSSIHLSTHQYAIPLYMGGAYTELAMIKLAGAVGLMNYGLYDSKEGAGIPGYPNNKIFQSSEITLGAAQQLVQTLISPSLVLAPGIYWFSWAANGAFRWSGLNELGLLGYSVTGSTLSIPQRIFSIVPYAASLPATWTATINSALAGIPPVLFQVKEI